MAFRLDQSRPLDQAVREAACSELASAIAWSQTSERGKSGSRRTHEIRKSMKRLRALLRLMRDGLQVRDFQTLNRECRDIARALANRRDSDVRRETLTSLLKKSDPPVGAALKKLLSVPERPAGIRGRDGEKHSAVKPSRDVTARLRALSNRVDELKIKAPFDALESGLRSAVRKVREARATAREERTGDAFHELRKTIQVHQRHLQLLNSAGPELLKSRIKAVRDLAQDLGREHDLTALLVWLAEKEQELSRNEAKLIVRMCRREQNKLRQQALADCRGLFSMKPKAYARTMVKAWRKDVEAQT